MISPKTPSSPADAWITSTLLADSGALPLASRLRTLTPGLRLAGPALTVHVPAGDNLAIHAALSRARPGDVLVIDGQAHLERALMGGIMSTQAKAAGVAGVVIDGAMRDVAELPAIGLPAFACGVHPAGPHKAGPGRVGHPVHCAGVEVRPGDWIFGDDDGVVVVPAARREQIVAAAGAKLAREQARLAAIARGELVAAWLADALAAGGVEFADDTAR
ncbi:MAG: RraA family protein [Burkholderiales bacterium]|jgi:RraA family protein|nr:RraA family protein [Burkholderiales bacterium]